MTLPSDPNPTPGPTPDPRSTPGPHPPRRRGRAAGAAQDARGLGRQRARARRPQEPSGRVRRDRHDQHPLHLRRGLHGPAEAARPAQQDLLHRLRCRATAGACYCALLCFTVPGRSPPSPLPPPAATALFALATMAGIPWLHLLSPGYHGYTYYDCTCYGYTCFGCTCYGCT